MNELAIAALLACCLFAFSDWRRGMFITIAVAMLQDPIRKIVPGQPVYFILFAGMVYGATFLGAMRAHVPLSPRMVVGWQSRVAVPFQIFVLIVVVQSAHSLLRFGVPMVSVLGLISYLAPFVALTLAHAFAATFGSSGVRKLLLFYVVAGVAALSTVYLESSGLLLPIFGEVGTGIRIYDQGGILVAHSGIYRASEIAAWHAAACSCVVLLLMTQRGFSIERVAFALVIVAAIVGLGILTGRRKFIVMIVIFCSIYAGLMCFFLPRMRVAAIPAILLGILAYVLFLLVAEPEGRSATGLVVSTSDMGYQLYVRRLNSVFGDVNDRFLELGLAPVMWAYDWFGVWGGGAGIGTQGVQHMTDVGLHVGAAEGGLGKIMLELGLPGLLAVGILGWTLARHVALLLKQVGRQSAQHTRLACALVAFLVANLASFSVATQAFGDIFILLFLGICFGALMAIPRMIEKDIELQKRANQGPRSFYRHKTLHSSLWP